LIGVVHLLPLPGSPRARGSFDAVVRAALRDAKALVEGGMTALLVENYGDVPFTGGRVPAMTVAAMTRCARAIRETFPRMPLGVNVLRNDGLSALAIAVAVGASFIRVNVLSGVAVTDQGLVEGIAHDLMRARRDLRANVHVLADVNVKHATPLGAGDLGMAARDLVSRALADGLIVTGAATGMPPPSAEIEAVRRAVPETPLWIGSGVTQSTVADALDAAEGVIVGTALKRGSVTTAPVDVRRVRRLVRTAGGHGGGGGTANR
jgi:membrane complex biogenesis BtpA family protein